MDQAKKLAQAASKVTETHPGAAAGMAGAINAAKSGAQHVCIIWYYLVERKAQ